MGSKVDAFVGSCGTEVSVLWEAIGELDRDQCYVLVSLWGIGRLAVSDREVAEELDIDVADARPALADVAPVGDGVPRRDRTG